MASLLVERGAQGRIETWQRVHVKELRLVGVSDAHYETFLEDAIADDPSLLGYGADHDASRVQGPFVAFRQKSLKSFNANSITPDIVILCASGDVLVVEVKLFGNSELRDRRVVAQVLEYAACLSKASERDLAVLFGGSPSESWAEFVDAQFRGKVGNTKALANQLLQRFRSRNLQLAIAADEVPEGLTELVDGVVGQNAVGDYEFRVIEIATFVNAEKTRVMFVPRTRTQTEVVERIVVDVKVGQNNDTQVNVDVKTTKSDLPGRASGWTEDRFFAATEALSDATKSGLRALYDHARDHGFGIEFGRGAKLGTISIRIGGREVAQLMTDGTLLIALANVDRGAAEVARTRLLPLGIDVPVASYRQYRPDVWLGKRTEIVRVLDALREAIPG